MSKRLILILAFAFVVGLSFAAYAEVQNVKVSGDLYISGVYRNNFDLSKTLRPATADTTTYDDLEKDLLSIVRVRVDADLTDNVSATVRLLNERNWNGESSASTGENNRNIGLGAPNGSTTNIAKDQSVDLDLAYVTLKEFLYSPLTITAGRQLLRFGNGWLVGDPDTNGIALRSALAEGDLSMRKSFDAVRATLDYNPLVVDIIYSKLAENSSIRNDDTTLTGINAAYELDKNTTLEGFFFSKVKGVDTAAVVNLQAGNNTSFVGATAGTRPIRDLADKVFTVGSRVVNKTIKNLTVDLQGAFQFGTYNPKFDPNARYFSEYHKAETAQRRAWGAEFIASYDLKDIALISKWKPSIAAAYIHLSGADVNREGNDKRYTGWDGMFEDQTFGHILNAVMGFSNVKLAGVVAQAKPMDDITARVDYVAAWWAKKYPDNRVVVLSGVEGARQFWMRNKSWLGQEVDLTLTYDYTEDVQFSLLGGIFLPGGSINEQENSANTRPKRATATELIGSMKVVF